MNTSVWFNVIAVATGGAIGALCRFGVGVAMIRFNANAAPLGTLFVNVVGCFLVGLFVPWFEQAGIRPAIRLLMVTGFCGALTTFSTFGYEILLLAKTNARVDLALSYAIANLGLGLVAVWVGGRIASSLTSGGVP